MHICTIVFKNYLSFARVLTRSFLEHHPEGTCTVLVIDGPDARIDPAAEPFDVILPKDIGLPDFQRMTEDYDVTELSTAVKPWLMRTLLERHGTVSYFDPDIRVYDRMDELQGLIEEHGIVVMPHFTGPIPLDGKRPSENDILIAGTYNLGYLGLGDTDQARDMLDWWSERLERHCLIDPARGFFVDQRWIDLVPGRYDRTEIYRDPGHDVAYWNLPHREVGLDGGRYTVNGRPLRFFHFSGFDPRTRHLLSKHQDRISLADDPVLAQLCRDYAQELVDEGFLETTTWETGFQLFADGRKLNRVLRRLRREAREAGVLNGPITTDQGREAFFSWLRQPARIGAEGHVNRYLLAVWESRADLMSEFPDLRTSDADRYVEWAQTHGSQEPDMIAELLPEVLRLPDGTPIDGVLHALWVEAYRLRALDEPVTTPEGAAEFVAWLNGPDAIGGRRGVTRYLRGVWNSREDLQRTMPHLNGPDGTRLVEWARAFAAAEAGAPAALLPSSGGDEDDGSEPEFDFDAADEADAVMDLDIDAEGSVGPPVAHWGVNVTGYLNAELGVGEVARKMISALDARGIPLVARGQLAPGSRQGHAFSTSGSEAAPFPVNLVCINADVFPVFGKEVGRGFFRDRFTAGMWFWEISSFPHRFAKAFEYVDEVWVATQHIAEALELESTKPIRHVRVPIELPDGIEPAREELGMPDGFVFLFVFDFHSVFRRKNPLGLIEAFNRAFPDGGASLVIKTINGDHHPARAEHLRVLASEQPNLYLLEDYLSSAAKNSLIASCDCYVSLHRSEGLGLTMGEAMYLGKPVVATGYSGNLDFMTPENSWLVDYELVNVGSDAEPYPADARWAEPDLDHAAACQREVFDDPALAAERGRRGAEDIRRTHSSAVAGARLEAILQEVTPPPRSQRPVAAATPPPVTGRGSRRAVNALTEEVAALSEVVQGLQDRLEEAERARVAGDADAAAQVRKLGARLDDISATLGALRSSADTTARDSR
ncbi:MAG: glycosyltransferase family 4 protein [Solirubrobacteraceae bacterium]